MGEAGGVETAEGDGDGVLMCGQPVADRPDRDIGCLLRRIAVDAGRDGGKGDGGAAGRRREVERAGVAGGEQRRLALIAAAQAVDQSGLSIDGELADRAGVILGTSGGGLSTQDENFRVVYEEGKNRVHSFVVPRLMANAATSHVSMIHGLRGPSYAVSTACASSNHAMGQAFQMVRSGAAPVMLTGGSEAMLCFGGVKAWEGLRVMSRDACRPFCATRNGMVQGEGAAVYVFEDWDHAMARRAEILAEVAQVRIVQFRQLCKYVLLPVLQARHRPIQVPQVGIV